MSPPRSLPVFEFPEWLGAITVRELRAGLMARDMVFLLIGTQLALAFTGIYAIEWSATTPRDAAQMLQGVVYVAALLGLGLHFPLRALRSLHAERESGMLALLQLTPQSSGRIVFGKWVSGAIQSALFVATLLPFIVLRYFVGGADLVADTALLLVSFATSLVLQAICLLLSTLPRLLRGVAMLALLLTGVIFGAQLLFNRSLRGAVGPVEFGPELAASLGMCALLAALVLTGTAQVVAAAAENYVTRFRLLLLASLGLWFAASSWLGTGGRLEVPAIVVPAVLVAGVAFFELAAQATFLATHVPPGWRRVPIGGFFVQFLLPGWRSAVLFYGVVGFGMFLLSAVTDQPAELTTALLQGLALLLLPRAVLVAARLESRGSGVPMLLLLHAAFGFIAASIGAVFSFSMVKPDWVQWFPATGFWNGFAWSKGDWSPLPPALWTMGLGLFLWWRARPQLRLAREARRAAARPAPKSP